MEALNLLKFWRNAGRFLRNAGRCWRNAESDDDCKKSDDVRNQPLKTGEETEDDDSFFDLDIAALECSEHSSEKKVKAGFNFVDSPKDVSCSDDCKKSDDLRNQPLKIGEEIEDDDSLFELDIAALECSEDKDVSCNKKVFPVDTNVSKPQSPIALLKWAPKFRVFMLGLKKSKVEKTETNGDLTASPKQKEFQNGKSSDNGQSKRFAVKCKADEVQADNSLRSKLQRESLDEFSIQKASSKRFMKDEVPKYLKLIKPLYERASKRYGKKTRISDQFSTVSLRKPSEEKPVNRAASLKVVFKHIWKSRSASSAIKMTPLPTNRRDDSSLLHQNELIQDAILYCKRSYYSANYSKEMQQGVARLAGLLRITMVLNSVQPVISSVAVRGGWQALVAYINLGCYYIFGLPLGFVLGYTENLGVMGLWGGMIAGLALQTFLLLVVLYKTNWNKEVEQTTERRRKWGGQDVETDKLARDQLSFGNREP